MIPDIFIQLAVALGLGLLVGLQLERVDSAIAGIRTFALNTLFGAIAGQLGKTFGGWIVAVGFVCVALLVTAGNLVRKEAEPGQTTELAALVMYGDRDVGGGRVDASGRRSRRCRGAVAPSAGASP